MTKSKEIKLLKFQTERFKYYEDQLLTIAKEMNQQ